MTVGLLRSKTVNVQVFESAPSFGEIGAGISFGMNAVSALSKLGLGEAFDRLATTVPSGQYFQWRGGQGEDQHLLSETYARPHGNSSVHRARFLDEIVKHIPEDIVHFGKRFERVEELQGNEHRYRIFFEDGSTHDTDVVIGCDGIHSNVRKYLRREKLYNSKSIGTTQPADAKPPKDLMWSGTWAYRGLIPTSDFLSALGEEKGRLYGLTPQMFLGKDRHILTFPIDGGDVINVVAFKTDRSQWPRRAILEESEPWTQKTTQEELLSDFPGWGSDMIKLLKCIPQPPSKWALHTIDSPLESYVHKGVVVAGDAAHGGCPHHGAMAGQAIEDALFYSTLLGHPAITKENAHEALKVVDEIRLPRANRTMQESLRLGDKYELASEEFGDDIEKVAQWLVHAWDWIWNVDHDKEWHRAWSWLVQNHIVKEDTKQQEKHNGKRKARRGDAVENVLRKSKRAAIKS